MLLRGGNIGKVTHSAVAAHATRLELVQGCALAVVQYVCTYSRKGMAVGQTQRPRDHLSKSLDPRLANATTGMVWGAVTHLVGRIYPGSSCTGMVLGQILKLPDYPGMVSRSQVIKYY